MSEPPSKAQSVSKLPLEVVTGYYQLLGVEPGIELSALRKAYLKTCINVHPDKNPDNPRAEQLFNEVKSAYDLLNDEKVRSDVVNRLAAKAQEAERFKALDANKRKLREDLAAREAAATKSRQDTLQHEHTTDQHRQVRKTIATFTLLLCSTHTHTHAHTHTHTHTHTHGHTYIQTHARTHTQHTCTSILSYGLFRPASADVCSS
jgi:curved DNA-binding protein CbpA